MKIKIESTGHFDGTTFAMAIVLILATIPAIALYVLISTFLR